MIVLRPEQIQAFKLAAQSRFENWMVRYIARRSPANISASGEEAVRRLIRLGIRRSQASGISKGAETCTYILIMLVLGSDFDTDPLYPWAAELLRGQPDSPAAERVALLRRRTRRFLENADGPRAENLDRAIERVRCSSLTELLPDSDGKLEEYAAGRLRFLQPEKLDQVGTAVIPRLLRKGIETATAVGAPNIRAITMIAGLMFMLGHGFFRDPQYPWFCRAFDKAKESKNALTVSRLHRLVLAHLEKSQTRMSIGS